MGLRFTKHIKLGKHLRLNISKSGIGISGGVKGARISYNPKTGIRRSIGIPGSGIYYSDQHKIKTNRKIPNLKQNIKPITISSKLQINKVSSANAILFKSYLKVFFGFAFLDVLLFKSNGTLMTVITWIMIISYICTRISTHKKNKASNEEHIPL